MFSTVQEITKTSNEEAALITNFINCWLDIDWSEASLRTIKSTIKTAREMIANPFYAEMVKIARES